MLESKQIKISFSNKILFENLCFKAQQGQILMLLGKNGSGKSTLLKLIRGEIQSQSGEIILFEKELSKYSRKEISNLYAHVLQDNERGTFSEFTVLENLCFAMKKGKSLSFFRSAVSEKKKVISFLEQNAPQFINKLEQKVSSLSGGQRQLLSILMNMASEAKVFLLDEPTAALDENASHEIMSQLQKWVREKNLIAVMVCHDSLLVARYGDAVLSLG